MARFEGVKCRALAHSKIGAGGAGTVLRLALAALAPLRAVAMVFTPSPDTAGHMRSNWDNWGQVHNGTWYLYYIVGGECPGR